MIKEVSGEAKEVSGEAKETSGEAKEVSGETKETSFITPETSAMTAGTPFIITKTSDDEFSGQLNNNSADNQSGTRGDKGISISSGGRSR